MGTARRDGRWTKRDGKRFIYESALVLNLAAFLCLFIGFCTPYWIISWPRVHSPFKKIGLWEVCFAGMVLESDPTQKAYHGCWWILAPEFVNIRQWLMPAWFIYTQVNCTLCFIAYGCGFVLNLINYIKTGRTQRNPEKKRTDQLKIINTICGITVGSAMAMGINMLVFAVMYRFDRYYLPIPFFNYLSWSFGLALLSTFFQVFASIGHVTYVLMVRQEMREPPAPPSVPLTGLLPTKDGGKGPMALGHYRAESREKI